jgi:hypothetical protein
VNVPGELNLQQRAVVDWNPTEFPVAGAGVNEIDDLLVPLSHPLVWVLMAE